MELTQKEWLPVQGCPLFRDMEEQSVRQVVNGGMWRRKEYAKGEVIYDPDTFSRKLGLLLTGKVRVSKGELAVSRLKPGELFGAAALFNQAPDYVTTLTAVTPCTVLLVTEEQLDEMMEKYPQIRRNYIAYLSGRIRFLSSKLEELTGPRAEDKLLHYFKQHSLGGKIKLDCSMTELARRLDMGRATLYRALETLEKQKVIWRDGKTVLLNRQEYKEEEK